MEIKRDRCLFAILNVLRLYLKCSVKQWVSQEKIAPHLRRHQSRRETRTRKKSFIYAYDYWIQQSRRGEKTIIIHHSSWNEKGKRERANCRPVASMCLIGVVVRIVWNWLTDWKQVMKSTYQAGMSACMPYGSFRFLITSLIFRTHFILHASFLSSEPFSFLCVFSTDGDDRQLT